MFSADSGRGPCIWSGQRSKKERGNGAGTPAPTPRPEGATWRIYGWEILGVCLLTKRIVYIYIYVCVYIYICASVCTWYELTDFVHTWIFRLTRTWCVVAASWCQSHLAAGAEFHKSGHISFLFSPDSEANADCRLLVVMWHVARAVWPASGRTLYRGCKTFKTFWAFITFQMWTALKVRGGGSNAPIPYTQQCVKATGACTSSWWSTERTDNRDSDLKHCHDRFRMFELHRGSICYSSRFAMRTARAQRIGQRGKKRANLVQPKAKWGQTLPSLVWSWAEQEPTWAQLGHNLRRTRPGPNLSPTGAQHGATWLCGAEVGPKTGPMLARWPWTNAGPCDAHGSPSHVQKWRNLGPSYDSFTPSWAQRRYNMGNIASNEASSIQILSSMAERLFCQHLLILPHFCRLSSIAKEVENTSENRHWRFRIGPATSSTLKPYGLQLGPKLLPNGSNLRPGCDILKPSWAEVAAKWVQVGPKLGPCWPKLGPCWPKLGPCWPKLTPSLADMLDRNGAFGRFWANLQNAQFTTVLYFLAPWPGRTWDRSIIPCLTKARADLGVYVAGSVEIVWPLALLGKIARASGPASVRSRKPFFSGLASPQSLLCRAMASDVSGGILRGAHCQLSHPKAKV